jgi:hypothetical protein
MLPCILTAPHKIFPATGSKKWVKTPFPSPLRFPNLPPSGSHCSDLAPIAAHFIFLTKTLNPFYGPITL